MTVSIDGLARPASSDAGRGISVTDATVTYRNGHTALRDASFRIPTGTITALVGVNGSRKPTLFKAIMGFLRPARGEIRVLGMPVERALHKNLVAYVPQAEEVDWNFPVLVEDVVMMGRYGHMGFLRIPSRRDRQMIYYSCDAEAVRRLLSMLSEFFGTSRLHQAQMDGKPDRRSGEILAGAKD